MNYQISEKEFGGQLEDLCKLLGWTYYHTWRAIHSPAGFPDYVLVKPPRIIFAELKTEKGKVKPAQQEWLDILAQCGDKIEVYLWRPHELEEIANILSTGMVYL